MHRVQTVRSDHADNGLEHGSGAMEDPLDFVRADELHGCAREIWDVEEAGDAC